MLLFLNRFFLIIKYSFPHKCKSASDKAKRNENGFLKQSCFINILPLRLEPWGEEKWSFKGVGKISLEEEWLQKLSRMETT